MTPQQKLMVEMMFSESLNEKAISAGRKAFDILNGQVATEKGNKALVGIESADITEVMHCIMSEYPGIQWEIYTLAETGLTKEAYAFEIDQIDYDKPRARLFLIKSGLPENFRDVMYIVNSMHNENTMEPSLVIADQATYRQLIPYSTTDTHCVGQI